MPILQSSTTKEEAIKTFQKQVNKLRNKYSSVLQMFDDIRGNFTRLEMMIIDSAYKGMSLENLDRTLLLKQDNYIKLLQNATKKLSSILKLY